MFLKCTKNRNNNLCISLKKIHNFETNLTLNFSLIEKFPWINFLIYLISIKNFD